MSALTQKITDELFVDSTYHSAKDKARMVKALVAFVESGYDKAKFTKAAYELTQAFSMPAYYSITGFFHASFDSARAHQQFVREFDQHVWQLSQLDPERMSDVAKLFRRGGLLADLFTNNPFPLMDHGLTVGFDQTREAFTVSLTATGAPAAELDRRGLNRLADRILELLAQHPDAA